MNKQSPKEKIIPLDSIADDEWGRIIKTISRALDQDKTAQELADPYTSETRRQEIYRIFGCLLFLAVIPAIGIVVVKKIVQLIDKVRHREK